MANAKYEFVPGDEKVIAFGRTLKRIRALVTLSYFVSPGSLGGYIESESCLSASGDAWVYGNAHVSGNAQVYGNARVSGNARVYGDAWVSGNAQVYGDAQVYGNARVSGDARVYGDAWVYGNAQVYGRGLIVWFTGVGTEYGTLTVYNTKDNSIKVTRGCFHGTVDEFLSASESKHDDDTHLEYRLLIEVAHNRITKARSALPVPVEAAK